MWAVPPASRMVRCLPLVVCDFPSGLPPAVKLVAGFVVGLRALTMTEELLHGVAICLGGARSMQICNPWHNRRFVVCLETRRLDRGLFVGLLEGTLLPVKVWLVHGVGVGAGPVNEAGKL